MTGGLRAVGRSRKRPARRDVAALSKLRLFYDESLGWRLRGLARRIGGPSGRPDPARRADDVRALSATLAPLTEAELQAHLRRAPPAPQLLDSAAGLAHIAAVHQVISRHTGLSLRRNQVECALRLLAGDCVELRTGEGKTLSAAMAALVAASVGMPVHVITVNDYLAARDHAILAPLARALGLTSAALLQDMKDDEKRAVYDCDIVYGTNKTFVFDALRDRRDARVQKSRAVARQAGQALAIVDEADSVLIDDATTPMILSEPLRAVPAADAVLFAALVEFARSCAEGVHRTRDGAGVWRLTVAGIDHLAACAQGWAHPAARDDDAIQLGESALAAVHSFHDRVHYILRDGAVVMVDQATGRLMPDRKWAFGLQQMIEIKEGLPPTAETRTAGQITQQTYFRQYLHLSGLTGTARECRGELWAIYGLAVSPVAPHAPSRLVNQGLFVHKTGAAKWAAVAARARAVAQTRAVLIGVNDVAEVAALARAFDDGPPVDLAVLDALSEAQEAAIVAAAGRVGRITLATHLAGRGTDIGLHPDVRAAGGLHVILASTFASARLERQLAGRAGRQGDPGSFETHIACDDRGLSEGVGWVRRVAVRWALRAGLWPAFVLARMQAARDRRARKLRRMSLLREQQLAQSLGYR